MNSLEIKLLRQLFFLSVAEAADHISLDTQQQWQKYESGDEPIPENVINTIRELAENYMQMEESSVGYIEYCLEEMEKKGDIETIPLLADMMYDDVDFEFNSESDRFLFAKLNYSICARMLIEYHGSVALVQTKLN